MRDPLGDYYTPTNASERESLIRLNTYINAGEDIVIDRRSINGKIPQFKEFWSIVAEFIEDKTAVSDRRHNSLDDQGDIVVYMAMANSYADMY